jgi:hypothetical protein
MKQIIFAIATAASLTVTPVFAQNDATPSDQGVDLIEEGAKLLLRGLLQEAEPAIQELRGLAENVGPTMKMLREEMGPALADVISKVDDIKNYAPPAILPNGDIVIRRKDDAPVYLPPKPEAPTATQGETDL